MDCEDPINMMDEELVAKLNKVAIEILEVFDREGISTRRGAFIIFCILQTIKKSCPHCYVGAIQDAGFALY